MALTVLDQTLGMGSPVFALYCSHLQMENKCTQTLAVHGPFFLSLTAQYSKFISQCRFFLHVYCEIIHLIVDWWFHNLFYLHEKKFMTESLMNILKQENATYGTIRCQRSHLTKRQRSQYIVNRKQIPIEKNRAWLNSRGKLQFGGNDIWLPLILLTW